MASKKINMKTSMSAVNVKQLQRKHRLKKKTQKLKTIFVNPCRAKFDKLSAQEAQDFTNMMQEEIKNSAFPGRCYACVNRIALGLESGLRAITNHEASCVLISHSIKPKFIINQIGYFSQGRNPNTRVLTVTNLENYAEKLFGVRALVIVLPLRLPYKVLEWINDRKRWRKGSKQSKVNDIYKTIDSMRSSIDLQNYYLAKPKDEQVRAYTPRNVLKENKSVGSSELKEWLGDYIAFSKKRHQQELRKEKFEEDKDRMLAALRRMASNIEGEETLFQKEIENMKQARARARAKAGESINWNTVSPNLKSYRPLEVHKIQPNTEMRSRYRRKRAKETIVVI